MCAVLAVRRCARSLVVAFVGTWCFAAPAWAQNAPPQPVRGVEVFCRNWQIGAADGRTGDGLGPVHNAASCVACHFQGGTGGAGPNDNNVQMLTFADDDTTRRKARRSSVQRSLLAATHPDFSQANAIILHRFGASDEYAPWRERILDIDVPEGLSPVQAALRRKAIRRRTARQRPVETIRHNGVPLLLSQRNTPALFGAGTIDRISAEDMRAIEREQAKRHSGESGRVPPAGEGDVGRFGWRGQIATLEAFVLSACANELGLQTPNHPQPLDPIERTTSTGEDMTFAECQALVKFVADLPPPRRIVPTDRAAAALVNNGELLFGNLGCAVCHVADVGPAEGIYSDLLLHDLGPGLADPLPARPLTVRTGTEANSYYGVTTTRDILADVDTNARQEWRTPPLWGVRDSAPYLHDGRAATLEDAIALHGGEAAPAAGRFLELPEPARSNVLLFLNTMGAP